VNIVDANGNRAVPVRYGRYSSVSGVGIRRDFRKVVCVASRFAGSSSRPDQADEKVAVIVFVGGYIAGGIGHGKDVAVSVIGIGGRFTVGKRYLDKAAQTVVRVVRRVAEPISRRILRAAVVVRLALGVSGGIRGYEQTVV